MNKHNPKMKYRILATALAVGVFTFGWFDLRSVFAQTVNTSVEQISLSASLFGSDNRIISNGTYEVRFGIYTANRAVADPYPSNADIGSRLWEEVQTVTVKNGIFRAFLGSVAPLPDTLNFENGDYYIGIRIGTDSEMIPRKQLGSVPRAVNSQFLQGRTIGTKKGDIALLGKSGRMDAKRLPSTITYLGNTIDLTSVVDGILPIANGGTGLGDTPAAGQILIGNGSSYTLGVITGSSITADSLDFTEFKDAMTLDVTTDIALGALTLSTSGTGAVSFDNTGLFTVAGNIDFNGTSNDIAGTLNLSGGSLTSSGALTITPGAGSNLNVALSTTGDFAVNINQLYVDTSTGNVGVGTANPASLFSVGTTSQFQVDSSGAIAAVTGITSSGLLSFIGTDHAGLRINNLTTAERDLLTPTAGMTIFNTTVTKMQVYNGTTWKNVGNPEIGAEVTGGTSGSVLFVDASGNLAQDNSNFYWDATDHRLGIGDTSPAAALTVGSGDLFQVNSSGTIAAAAGITSSGTITFSGLSTAGIVTNTSGGVLGTTVIVPVANGGTGAGTFTTNGILYGNTTSAFGVTAAGTDAQFLVAGVTGIPAFVTMSSDATISNTGALTISANAVALTTDTTGNYVATGASGSGVSLTGGGSEGATLTAALAPLTADWDQSGAFTISLNNVSAGLKMLENGATPSLYGIFDVADLSTADKTYTFPDASGTVLLSGGTLLTLAGTSGTNQTISQGDTLTIAAGTGITTTGGATDTVTIAATLGTSVDLTTEVTGTLPVANGGTGAGTFTTNGILYGNTTSAFGVTAAGTDAQFLVAGVTGIPAFVTMSSDATISNTGALTISANAVALTTDTTGNYVASATASGGLTMTGTEGGSLGILLQPSGDALSATTSSGSGLEILSTGLTLLQGCAASEVLAWNETTDVWACSTVGSGSVTADSLDFTEFQDTLDLDAALTLNQTTNIWSQTFTGLATTGLAYTATSLTTGSALNVTTTNTAATNTALSAVQFNLTNAQATLANTAGVTGLAVNFTNNPTIAGNTEYALRIQNQDTANITDNAVAALLLLDNADTVTTGTTIVTDAILITNSGGSNFTNFLNTPTLDISAAGAITGATSITSSGTITFSGLSTAGIVTNTAGGVLGTTTAVSVALGGTGTSTQFTQGSVVFAGASGAYTQDNANFFWDDTNNRLGIGDATPDALLDLDLSQTSGILFGISAPSSVTLAGTLTGQSIDLSANVTAAHQSVTGTSVTLPTVTNTGVSTYIYKGLQVTGNTITQNLLPGVDNFMGVDITNADLAGTGGGTQTSRGINVTTGSITGTAFKTQYGFKVNASGVDGGTLVGIDISGITAGTGTETAISVGSGWDTLLDTASLDISGAGAITGATGITSSGTITFSGLSTAGIVTNTSGGVLGTTATVPVANGGTNATTIGSAGSIAYSDGSAYAFSAVGTSGQALVSGGAGAPTFFAPTLGSVLFATTSGALAQDNANFFWDDTNNRLGIGDVTPDGVLDFDFSSTSTAGASEYGANFTVSDTGVVTIGNTDTTYGTYTSLTRTGASGGTINSYGQYITATGDNGGNSTMYGSYLTATGADTVYGYYASVTGNTSTKSGYYANVTDSGDGLTRYGTNINITVAGGSPSALDISYGDYIKVTRTGALSGLPASYGEYILMNTDTGGTSFAYGSFIDTGVSGSTNADATYGQYITTEANAGTTAYGIYVDVGAEAGTEYSGIFLNGNFGIGDTTPAALFTVGNTDLFQVNSSGAIAAAASITSSGTITFSGLSTAGIVTNTAGGVLGTTVTVPVANGGSGAGTFTTNGILYGNTTSAFGVTAAGTDAQFLVAGATGIPAFVSMSSDVTITNAGVATIAANAVALTTDTTGNYVASATASGGLTLTGTEGGSLGILLQPSGDALSATTSSGSGLEILSTGLTLLQGCAASEVLVWNETTDVWACSTVGSGSVTADSLDFTEFQDTLDLDAALVLNQTTNTWSQTFTGDTTTGLLYTADSLTSGKAFSIASAATAFTGSLQEITLSGSNAANTGSLLTLTNSGTANANTSLYVKHYATGTNNLAFRVDDVSGDTTPFVIDGTGAVGIGTTAPSGALELYGTGAADEVLTLTSADTTYDPVIKFRTAASPTIQFSLGVDNSDSDKFKIYSGDGLGSGDEFVIDSAGVTSIANLNLGATAFDTDAGAVVWVDMPVTSAASLGTIERYTAQIDNNALLTVYAESDGAGSIQNSGVSIGNATLQSGAKFAVTQSSISTTASSTLYGMYNSVSDTGIVTATGDDTYGNYTTVTRTGATTAGTFNAYGNYTLLTTDNAGAATSNAYGSYIDTGTAGATNADTVYGMYINTESNAGTAYGLYVDAGAGAGTEYAAIFLNGNFGIGDASPAALLTVGDGDDFQVNSTGAIAAATGITSSGTITFSGLSTAGIVTNTAGGVLGTTVTVPVANGGTGLASYTVGDILYASGTTTLAGLADVATGSVLISGGVGVAPAWGTVGAAAITADSLDFTEFQDTLDLDAALVLNQTTNTWSQTFTGDTTTGLLYTADSLTSGKAFSIASSATAFTGSLADITLSGSNAANTGSLLTLTNSGTSNANTSLTIQHNATGTGNLAFRVNDVASDTTPFVIDGAGNVGVGTATPGVTLDVAGAVRTNNNIYANGGISNFTSLNDVINVNKTLSANATDSWSTGTAGGTARAQYTSVLYNGKIYSWGGYVSGAVNTLDIYDIASGSWSIGTAGGTARQNQTSVLYNGKIYSWGGRNGTNFNTVDIYDIANNSWSTGTAGGTARYSHTSVLYNGKIYSWGGYTTTAVNTVDIYDIANNSWSTGTAGGTARYTHTSVLYNGKMYSWGGYDASFAKLNTIDIYDIANNSWSTGTAGGTARIGQTSVLYNGKIYSWGGAGASALNTVDIYDIASGTWSTGTAGGTARYTHTSVLYNGKMYSWGGQNGASYYNTVDIYDIGFKQNILAIQENGQDTLNFQTGSQMFLSSGRLGIMGGNVGIGDASPAALLTVGDGDDFQINTTGAITAATGITSSGTITFSGFTTDGGLLYTNGSGVLAQTGAGTSTTILHGGTTPSYSAVSLTADVTGVLPIANGGSNKALTLAAGAVLWTDADSFEVTAAGTAGQALISGGTTTPTWFAPTAGSVLFAGTGGILQQDNASLFFDDSTNRLGIGTITPAAMLDIYGASNALRLSYDATNYNTFSTASDGTLSVASSNVTESQVLIGSGGAVDDSVAFDGATQDYYAGLDDTTGSFMIGSGFTVGSSSLLTITSGGLIGINMTPVARLDITHSSTSTTGATEYSERNTFSDTGVVTTGTDTTYGNYLSTTRTGATGGTINSYGQYNVLTTDNAGAGTSTAYGSYIDTGTAGATNADTVYGMYINTESNAGTAYGLYVDVGAGAGTEYAGIFMNGNLGIGDASPAALLTVGDGDDFQVNSTGAIAAATGITSSGTITFSGFTTDGGLLYTNGSGVLAQTGAGTSTTILHGGTTPSYSAISLTADVTGVLPIANGGSNKALTLAAGAVLWTDADSFEVTAAGTAGQALISGGTTTPTWFAPTAGSVLFAGTSGILQQDNASLFFDDTTNRLGIGTITPAAMLDIYGTANAFRLSYDATNYNTFSTASDGTLNLTSTAATAAQLILGNNTAQDVSIAFNSDVNDFYAGVDDTLDKFMIGLGTAVGTTPFVTIDSSGNVGIGDTIPDGLLDMDSAATTTNVFGITNTGIFTGTGTSSVAQITADSATTGTLLNLSGNGLTSGKAFSIASSSTAFTGSLADITLSGSNAANTGSLLTISNTGTANTNTSLYVKHYATGTNNLAFRVDDVSGDTTPFVIDGTGAVGIGTTAPSGQAELYGTGSADEVLTLTSADTTYDPVIKFRTAASPTIQFTLGVDNSDSDKFKIYSGDGLGSGDEFVIDSSGVTSIANLNLGATNFDTDAGAVSWVDMPVTSSALIGTAESYTAMLDGNSLLTIYAESDGAGSIQNSGVGIGTTTPGGAKLAVLGGSSATATVATVTSTTVLTTTGNLLTLTANSATTATGVQTINATGLTSGYAQTINVNGAAVLTTGGALNIDGPTGAAVMDATTGLVNISSTGAITNTTAGAASGTLFQINGNGAITPTLASISDTSVMTTTGKLLDLTANAATTTTGLLTMNADGLTTGSAIAVNSASTGLTGSLQKITLSGSNAANTGNLLLIADTGAANTSTPFKVTAAGAATQVAALIENTGSGTSFRVNDESSDTTPFVIDASGNVGIGTAFATGAPADKLTVAGGSETIYDTASVGAEKVANGAFADASIWTFGTGWAHDAVSLEADHTAGNTADLEQNVSAVAGEVYQVVFTVVNRSAGSVTPQVGGVSGAAVAANTTSTIVIRATGTGNLKFTPTTDFNGSIDTVSVKLVTGGDLKLAGLLTGGGTTGLKVLASGNVGIGTTAPGYKLEVDTDVSANYAAQFFNDGNNADRYGIQIQGGADDGTGTTYYVNALDGDGGQVGYIANTAGTFALTDVSDIRTKTNIVTAEMNATSILGGLRVVNFNRISSPDGPKINGFIAQEVQEVYPNAVTVGPTGLLGISKDAFIPVLVKAFQEGDLRLTAAESALSSVLEQTEVTAGVLTDLNLQTAENITTLAELQSSVDTQLTVVGTTLNEQSIVNSQQEIINSEQSTVSSLQDTRLTDLEILAIELQNQLGSLASKTALLEAQMQTLTAQLSTLSDFFTTFDLGNLVAKDALGNIDLTRDALGNPVLLGGRLRATILETGGLVIEVADPLAPTIGTAEILPIAIDADSDGNDDFTGNPMTDPEVAARDGMSIIVNTKAMIPMAKGSRIFTTFKNNPNAFSWIEKVQDANDDYVGFKIRLSAPITAPVKVDWLLVEQKDVIAP